MLFNQDIFIWDVINNNSYQVDKEQPVNLLKYKDEISNYINHIAKELDSDEIITGRKTPNLRGREGTD